MDELLALIARIGTDDPPSVEELANARSELVENLRVATAADTRDLEAATAIRSAIDNIDTEQRRRTEAAEAEETEARRLLEGLEEPEAETDGETAEGSEEQPETDATETTREREPVAASASLRSALRRTTSVRMRQDEPEGTSDVRVMTINAAQSERLSPNATLRDVGAVFDRATQRVKRFGDKQSLVHIEYDYPENRRLTSAQRADNDRLLDTVLDPQAIAAAGGICDPLPADFSNPLIGDRGRPLRDALPRFQGARGGGVRFSPTITISLTSTPVSGTGVGVWTYETDVDPGDTTKTCHVVECAEEDTAYVEAVYACLEIGNFQARFNPEFWRARLQKLMLDHDRLAEQTLYADMVAGATAFTTYGGSNGTIYSVLSALDKTVAGMRSRLRYRGTMRVVLPEWVRAALRADIASQRLGSAPGDALTVADNIIDSFFTARGVRPVWSLDLDVFSAQAAGTSGSPVALNDFPGGNVDLLVYPEGAYFFLDGGTLDLGTEIVDSTLIAQNNRMAFLETFEKAVFRGGEAIRVTVPVDEVCVCPSTVAA